MPGEIYSNISDIDPDVISSLDAILVLGGGAPATPNDPPIYVKDRNKIAAEIFNKAKEDQAGKLPNILTLSAGTAHVPQLLSEDGLPVWESTASASYLINALSIPSEKVFVETTSYDTISNAFFARTSFTDVMGWKNLLIITNEFHIVRSKAIFDWVMNAPSSLTSGENVSNYELYYYSVPNVGLSNTALELREEKEAASLKFVQSTLSTKYTSVQGVFEFLTQDHGFYTASKLIERSNGKSESIGKMLKDSYGGQDQGQKMQALGSIVKDPTAFSFGLLVGVISCIVMYIVKTNPNQKVHRV